jgi:hypothetical protein
MSNNNYLLITPKKEINNTNRIRCYITLNNSGFYSTVEFSGKVHSTVDKFIKFVINKSVSKRGIIRLYWDKTGQILPFNNIESLNKLYILSVIFIFVIPFF